MTGARCLLDTGPVVAALHRGDRDHPRAEEFLRGFRGAFVTTEPILTEALHLLRKLPGGPDRCLAFFLGTNAIVAPPSRERLARCRRLMGEYADIPMDYADATLVALAEETGIRDVATFDRRGFAAYRAKGRPLRIAT